MRRVVLLLSVAVGLGAGPPSVAQAASWCGTDAAAADRQPDLVAGAQWHVVYATPADGPDRFLELAPLIVGDLEAIDAWWRAQDATRTLRFDLFDYPGCTPGLGQLDLSSVRLSLTAAQINNQAVWQLVMEQTSGPFRFDHLWKKYLVYYDGPAPVCGVGNTGLPRVGGPRSSAQVYLGACGADLGAGRHAAATAIHEMIHTMDALPSDPVPVPGPPHACPTDPGHVCEESRDILLRSAGRLDARVLDPGFDDYYRHGGRWTDVYDSPWLRHLDAPQFPLTVAVTGPGSVVSEEPGLACPLTCKATWDAGASVKLVAAPNRRSRLVRWSGACRGSRTECSVTVESAADVRAEFGPGHYDVRLAIRGRGVVGGSGFSCSRTCLRRAALPAGGTLRLRAAAARGYRFTGWSGACRGAGACVLHGTRNRSLVARFVRQSSP